MASARSRRKSHRCAVSGGRRLGIAWYLHPDTGLLGMVATQAIWNGNGKWRSLDDPLFDTLKAILGSGKRSVAAVEESGVLGDTLVADEALDISLVPLRYREAWREAWFGRVRRRLTGAEWVFADPDNGLCTNDVFNARRKRDAKRIPLREVELLAEDKPLVVYHHNSRRPGGHRAEIRYWQDTLPGRVDAYYWRRWSNRTFFFVGADFPMARRLEEFAARWEPHGVYLPGSGTGWR